MADTFTLSLPRYGRSWTFNRSHFLELFPNSLISNTLEQSPDTDIEITQPFVTPEAIDVLWSIAEEGIIPENIPSRDVLTQVGNYLNIDILVLLGNFEYLQYILRPLNITYDELINPGPGVLTDMMFTAVRRGYLPLLNYAIDKGANPSYNHNSSLIIASREGHLAIVNRLLEDPQVDPTVRENQPLREASSNGYLPVVQRLLQIPQVDPNQAIVSAGTPEILKVLLV